MLTEDRMDLELDITSQIMQKPELFASLSVPIEDFSNWEAVHILRAIGKMESEGVQVTVADIFRAGSEVDPSRLAVINGRAYTTANFHHHVKKLDSCIKHDALSSLSRVISGELEAGKEPEEVHALAEGLLHDMTKKTTIHKPMVLGDALKESVDKLQEKIKHPGMPGYTTGFHELNDAFGGFVPGRLHYLAARPSVGKTAMMLNFAMASLDANVPCGIISIESNISELADRLISNRGNVDGKAIKHGTVKPSDLAKVTNAVQYLYKRPGVMYFNPRATIVDIAVQTRRMARAGAKTIFIDYLQKIKPTADTRALPRHEQISGDSAELKALAEDLGIAMVCLAQINRGAADSVPSLANLKGSGAIEEDGDVVMLLHKEVREGETYMEVNVAKARDGNCIHMPVRFFGKYMRFQEE